MPGIDESSIIVTMTPEIEVSNTSPVQTNAGLSSVRDILGVDVSVLTGDRAVGKIDDVIAAKGQAHIAFLNAHGANLAYRDANYRKTLKGFTVLSDGVGVDLGSAMLYGDKFPQNLNGTDFVPRLFRQISRPVTVGLVGSRPGVAELARMQFEKNYPQHKFIVFGHGYFDATEEQQILSSIKSQRPDILLVALGNPTQEFWISRHCDADVTSVAIGVGALFDFVAGKVKRAPQWMINSRLEWVYRLWLEPARLWRRYILGNPVFVLRVLRQKIFGRRG